MSIYLIGAIKVNDEVQYQPYAEGAFASVQQYGVEALAYGEPQMIEGTKPGNRIILLRFEDEAALDRWYKSPEYQSVVPTRLRNAETPFLISLPGIG